MKIDFLGTYTQLSAYSTGNDVPAPNPAGRAKFDTLLADLITPKGQPSENLVLNQPTPALEAAPIVPKPEEVRARYNFSQNHLATAVPERLAVAAPPVKLEEPRSEPPKTEPDGVKPPSVLSVRRIPLNSEFKAMKLEDRMGHLKDLMTEAGKRHGVDPALGMAVAAAESSFDPSAVSKDGHYSKGLFQILDSTGKDLKARMKVEGKYDPYNPEFNIDLGVGYLRYLHDLFSTDTALTATKSTSAAANSTSLEKLALAAYNAGEGRVAQAQRQAKADGLNPSQFEDVRAYLPDSTKEYVDRVLNFRDRFQTSTSV